MQKSYSIYETKSKFSEILRAVKSGKRIVVSERGKPIAEIVPFVADEGFSLCFFERTPPKAGFFYRYFK